MLEEIRTLLLNKGLADIYIGRMPPLPDNCITLFSYGGRIPDAKYQYDRPSIQIQTRGSNYQETEQRANTIHSLLQSLSTTFIGSVWVVDIQSNQSPYHLLTDDKDRTVFVQNFNTEIYKELTNRT